MAIVSQIQVSLLDKHNGETHTRVLTMTDYGDHMSLDVPRIWYYGAKFDSIRTERVTVRGVLLPLYRHMLTNKIYAMSIDTEIGRLNVDLRDELWWNLTYA